MKRVTNRSRRGGFTLTEAAAAIILVGLGMAGMLASLSSGTKATQGGYELGRAGFLVRELREHTFAVPFDELTTQTYTQCIDGQGEAMSFADSEYWTQKIVVSRRQDDDLDTVDATNSSNFKYVQASILYHGQTVMQAGWLVAAEVAQ